MAIFCQQKKPWRDRHGFEMQLLKPEAVAQHDQREPRHIVLGEASRAEVVGADGGEADLGLEEAGVLGFVLVLFAEDEFGGDESCSSVVEEGAHAEAAADVELGAEVGFEVVEINGIEFDGGEFDDGGCLEREVEAVVVVLGAKAEAEVGEREGEGAEAETDVAHRLLDGSGGGLRGRFLRCSKGGEREECKEDRFHRYLVFWVFPMRRGYWKWGNYLN